MEALVYCMKCGYQLPDDANFCLQPAVRRRAKTGLGNIAIIHNK
jgi:hypothetical protein